MDKKLFKVVSGKMIKYFDSKADAKLFREDHGGTLYKGPDHIGSHGVNRVTKRMRDKRLGGF